ncbi:MAG: hypothetical protein U5L45_25175 [Saprospiraceae bacterium]|nr:hypothetical protein [Saprospiraceae bacterium]
MVHFSGFARKMDHISSLARAKRAQKCLLMRILNLCMVSKFQLRSLRSCEKKEGVHFIVFEGTDQILRRLEKKPQQVVTPPP